MPPTPYVVLASNRQLSHQIRCHIQEWIRTSYFLLLVAETTADGVPFGVTLVANDVLVAVALEINHEVVFFQLVELDIHKDPHAVDYFAAGGVFGK